MAFSWTTPVTDREDGTAMMTYTDMNRITKNIGYLQEQLYGSATLSKTSWVRNDIIDVTFWAELLEAIETLGESVSIAVTGLTDDMTYNNINAVETFELKVYQAVSGVTFEALTDHNNEPITDENYEEIEAPVYA